MINRTNRLRRAGIAVAALALSFGSAVAMAQTAPDVVPGVTKPYAHPKPGVNGMGTVLELPVKEGQVVKKDDVLLRQDDRAEQVELQRLQKEAESNVRVEAAEADLKLKEAQYKREKDLLASGNSNPFAVEEAQSKWIYADAQAKVAKLEQEKAKLDAEKQRIKVDQMTIRSAYDGRVESIDVEVGDATDPQKPLMTIAQNDPLKIEFYLPTAQAKRLKMGQQLQVRYTDDENWMPAAVTYKAPIADAASDTQKIGLEMKNTDGHDSGMQVLVKLPPEVAQVAQQAQPGQPAGAVPVPAPAAGVAANAPAARP